MKNILAYRKQLLSRGIRDGCVALLDIGGGKIVREFTQSPKIFADLTRCYEPCRLLINEIKLDKRIISTMGELRFQKV